MEASRSYYLAHRQNDFAETDATSQPDTTDVHYVTPANDNSPTTVTLTRAVVRFNDRVTCRRQSLLQIFDIVRGGQSLGVSVVLLVRTISLATDWRFMRLRLLLRWVAKHDAEIASQVHNPGR